MNDRVAALESSGARAPDAAPHDDVARDGAELRRRLASSQAEMEDLRAALRAAEAREQVFRRELQHRVRNMLAVIRSIFRRTRDSGASQEEFAEHFQGRVDAIARYQLNLGDPDAGGVEIEDIVRNELLQVGCGDGPTCTIAGPAVLLSDKAVELMGLAAHELATNSIKFGALAHGGMLRVEWSVDAPPADPRMHLRWIETGVPVVATAPREQGFGRQLIEEALPYQLGAVTSFDLRPGGLDCSIVIPLSGRPSRPSAIAAFAGGVAADGDGLPAEPE